MRVLLLHHREWIHPKAGPWEHGLHGLFTRLAGFGVHVTWLAHQYGGILRANRAPRVESQDGIELARIGFACFYPTTAALFLQRWEREAAAHTRYDVVLECVNGRMPTMAKHTVMPVLPLFLGLPRAARAGAQIQQPVLALGETVAQTLRDSGALPGNVLTLPPFPPSIRNDDDWQTLARSTLAALEVFLDLHAARTRP